MGYVFSSKTTKWYRFKVWFTDLVVHILALPSYIWPQPLRPTPLSPNEEIEFQNMVREELRLVKEEEECKHQFGHHAGDGYEICKNCGKQGPVAAKERE